MERLKFRLAEPALLAGRLTPSARWTAQSLNLISAKFEPEDLAVVAREPVNWEV